MRASGLVIAAAMALLLSVPAIVMLMDRHDEPVGKDVALSIMAGPRGKARATALLHEGDRLRLDWRSGDVAMTQRVTFERGHGDEKSHEHGPSTKGGGLYIATHTALYEFVWTNPSPDAARVEARATGSFQFFKRGEIVEGRPTEPGLADERKEKVR